MTKLFENIKYWLQDIYRTFWFLKVYFSPFKIIIPTFYIGKINYGVPFYFPRRWVKLSKKEILEKAKIVVERGDVLYKDMSISKIAELFKGYCKVKGDKLIGFDFVGLGYKYKFEQIRHEYNPIWSFVFFKWQIAILFIPEDDSQYWESWVYYEKHTDKSKSVEERIEQCRKEVPQTWRSWDNGEEKITDYYPLILKNKWKKLM